MQEGYSQSGKCYQYEANAQAAFFFSLFFRLYFFCGGRGLILGLLLVRQGCFFNQVFFVEKLLQLVRNALPPIFKPMFGVLALVFPFKVFCEVVQIRNIRRNG